MAERVADETIWEGDELADALRSLVVAGLSVDPTIVRPDASLAIDLHAGMMTRVRLADAIEDRFGVDLPECLNGLTTCGDLVRLIRQRLSDNAAA